MNALMLDLAAALPRRRAMERRVSSVARSRVTVRVIEGGDAPLGAVLRAPKMSPPRPSSRLR